MNFLDVTEKKSSLEGGAGLSEREVGRRVKAGGDEVEVR